MNAPLSLPPVWTAVIALFPDDGSTGGAMAADGLVRALESNRQTSWVDIGVRKNESVAVGAGWDAERLDGW